MMTVVAVINGFAAGWLLAQGNSMGWASLGAATWLTASVLAASWDKDGRLARFMKGGK